MAEPEVGADDDLYGGQPLDQGVLDELLSRLVGQGLGELDDDHAVGAMLLEKVDPAIERGQHQRHRLWA